jgi:hypothetical protein
MLHLPPTKRLLHANTNKSSQTNPRRIAHSRRSQTELAVLLRHLFPDSGESTDVHQATEQTLPEHNGENEPDGRDERVHGVHCEADKIEDLEDRGRVERADADEGERGARDEDAELVDCAVCRIEGAEVREWAGFKREEKRWGYALVDGVLGYINEEEREHVGDDKRAGAVEFGGEGMRDGLEPGVVGIGR